MEHVLNSNCIRHVVEGLSFRVWAHKNEGGLHDLNVRLCFIRIANLRVHLFSKGRTSKHRHGDVKEHDVYWLNAHLVAIKLLCNFQQWCLKQGYCCVEAFVRVCEEAATTQQVEFWKNRQVIVEGVLIRLNDDDPWTFAILNLAVERFKTVVQKVVLLKRLETLNTSVGNWGFRTLLFFHTFNFFYWGFVTHIDTSSETLHAQLYFFYVRYALAEHADSESDWELELLAEDCSWRFTEVGRELRFHWLGAAWPLRAQDRVDIRCATVRWRDDHAIWSLNSK